MGYTVRTDTFTSTYPGNPQGTSLIVTIPGTDASRMLLIGAHYDTVEGVAGCEDNATGVAALLETARRLAGTTPVMEVQLVFFDSEEYGHSGSEHYAARVADRTALMINLDCVGYGSYLYAYGPEGSSGAAREYAISRAPELGVSLTTHEGNATWSAGTTGPWSDHAAFERRGVPFLYLEAANFAVETNAAWWGYTAEDPDVLHSALDHPDYLLPRYGVRMELHMSGAAILVADLAINGFTSDAPSP
jgi:Zn-dependent M28 family amino/carboxypeptidase